MLTAHATEPMPVDGASRRSGITPCLDRRHESEYVGVAVVQRRRRNPDHVRLAPVANNASCCQVLEQGTATLAATGDTKRQLATATVLLGRGDDLQRFVEMFADQQFQIAGDLFRFR